MEKLPSETACSLLIVEDDKAALDLLARMVALRFPQYKICTAENGKKGLELFNEHSADLVITDINMPEMDGIEMARQMKSMADETRYIVLTAYGDTDNFGKFEELGFCAFLRKPISFEELFAAIETCIP